MEVEQMLGMQALLVGADAGIFAPPHATGSCGQKAQAAALSAEALFPPALSAALPLGETLQPVWLQQQAVMQQQQQRLQQAMQQQHFEQEAQRRRLERAVQQQQRLQQEVQQLRQQLQGTLVAA